MKKTFVIGDIHGGLRALKQLFEKAGVTKEDNLIFLGDFVDGWSESAQTISFLIDLQKEQDCIFIKGNHDVWCEEWLRTVHADSTWLEHGGMQTIESYKTINSTEKKQHLNFLERMGYMHVDEQNRLFIHAGFTSMHGPEHEFHSSNFNWDRTLWEMAIALDKTIPKSSFFFPKRLRLFKEIYIGHTPTLYFNETIPMQAGNVWNLDTGAAFTGKLSIMDVDTKEYWQSDQLLQLYPGERGRNKG